MMPYATLMLHAQGSTQVTGFACDLALHFGSSLIGMAARFPASSHVAPDAMRAVIAAAVRRERERAQAALDVAGAKFRASTRSHGVPGEWRSALGAPIDLVATQARGTDLFVMARPAPGAAASNALDPADVLMGIGGPLLVLPPVLPAAAIPARVVVAWKEGREARRAISDAMPYLQSAERVIVVEICREAGLAEARARGADIVDFLGRHAVAAEAMPLARTGMPVARHLLAVARAQRAELIVMGGYSHARLREWVLGGVTRDLLASSPVSLLLSR